VLSAADVRFAMDMNLQSITAVLKIGGQVKLERKGSEWPDEAKMMKAYKTGIARARERVINRPGRLNELRFAVVEINRALRSAFGDDAIQMDLQ